MIKGSSALHKVIYKLEGCSLDVYTDSAGYPTIGIGHMLKDTDTFTTPLANEEAAFDLLGADMKDLECWMDKTVGTLSLPPNRLDALLSLSFNIGIGNFRKSSMLRYLQARKIDAAAGEFTKWDKAGGKVQEGLIKRRLVEQGIFEASTQNVLNYSYPLTKSSREEAIHLIEGYLNDYAKDYPQTLLIRRRYA